MRSADASIEGGSMLSVHAVGCRVSPPRASGVSSYRRVRVLVALAAVVPFLLGFGDSPQARNRRGNKYYNESKYDEALTEYRSAQVLAPELEEVSFNAGNALYRKGELPDALREYQRAVGRDDPVLAAAAHYNAGDALFRMGDLEAAIESFKQSLRLNPDDEDAKYNLELALEMLRQQQSSQQENQEQEQDQQQEQPDSGESDQSDSGEEGEQEQKERDESDSGDSREPEQQETGEDAGSQESGQEIAPPKPEEGEEGIAQPMSKEDAERLLDAVEQAERELQAELRRAQAKKRVKVDKDW